jgi:Uma2 family endonuclease
MSGQSNTLTVKEYRRLGDTGILHAINTVELVQGSIVDKSSDGYRHTYSMKKLLGLFTKHCSQACIVSVQEPLLLNPITEVSPDIKLLRQREDFYSLKSPKGKDVLLLVEICEKDIDTDKKVKLPMYASLGIQEVWIVNLLDSRLEVFRVPQGSNYTQILLYKNEDTLRPLSFPNFEVKVSSIIEEPTK